MKILTYPNDLLTWPTCMVADFDENLRRLSEAMIITVKASDGLGLAANQVGSDLSVFVCKDGMSEDGFLVAVNPTVDGWCENILDFDLSKEGCLSLPGIQVETRRYNQVILKYQDLKGKDHDRPADGIFARVIQHEMDHLRGKLIWDQISQLNRNILKRRYKKVNKLKFKLR